MAPYVIEGCPNTSFVSNNSSSTYEQGYNDNYNQILNVSADADIIITIINTSKHIFKKICLKNNINFRGSGANNGHRLQKT